MTSNAVEEVKPICPYCKAGVSRGSDGWHEATARHPTAGNHQCVDYRPASVAEASVKPGLIEHRYTDHPVCPYCGHVHTDSWEWGDAEDGETDCESCSRRFTWTAVVHRTWSTRRLPPVMKK